MQLGSPHLTPWRHYVLPHAAGVIPRAIHQIFSHLDSINSEYTVKCSFLELYNEETTDLLAVGDSKAGQKLRMLEDKSGVVVQGEMLEAIRDWPLQQVEHCGQTVHINQSAVLSLMQCLLGRALGNAPV